ncbi:MFS general substrate transporter [Meira miltonrushii]|uniref:MFS general substrate transporter n=1 Tax=Meira miltonrushii TaxID=1280837 RepID=A0A316V182_9BASI|nr:MFS general substrate transporter [Meira miltonrushii]PWN31310.1 MFS general substrate transporter [Meira miltonrushii]
MREAAYQVGVFLDQHAKGVAKASRSKDRHFWLAFMGIAITGFLSATDMTIIAPILPTIAGDMPPSDISPTWITSAFLLAMMTFQPLWGGLSDAFGRQSTLLASVIIFLAGSIPCTVAKSMLTMVAGRGLQGVGGGGMLAIGEVMLSDMTTLAERGYFLGLLSMAFAVAAIAAPLVGGVFATHGGYLGWRWSFLINFPIGVVALAFVLSSNKFKPPPKLTMREKWAHCDATSALILFASTLSLLIGLTRGGEEYAWNDGRVVAPLICGIIGLIGFFALQWLPFKFLRSWFLAPRPVLDPAMFFGKGLRTNSISFILTFLHGILLYGAIQTLILYFETRDATPLRAAINVLPANVPSTPAAFIAGVLMAVTGRYKSLIIGSQVLMLVGLGMFVYLNSFSPTYQWVIFQLIASIGIGAMYTLALPPIQASLPPAYLARATATFAFVRSFGAIWGVSITLVAFSAQANKELDKVPGAYEAGFTGASAIGKTTSIGSVTPIELQTDIRNAFDQSLRVAFSVLVPFAAIGLFLAIFIKHIPLPNFNTSEYGLQEQEQGTEKSSSPHKNAEEGTSELDSAFSSPKVGGRLSTNQERNSIPLRRSDSFWH